MRQQGGATLSFLIYRAKARLILSVKARAAAYLPRRGLLYLKQYNIIKSFKRRIFYLPHSHIPQNFTLKLNILPSALIPNKS